MGTAARHHVLIGDAAQGAGSADLPPAPTPTAPALDTSALQLTQAAARTTLSAACLPPASPGPLCLWCFRVAVGLEATLHTCQAAFKPRVRRRRPGSQGPAVSEVHLLRDTQARLAAQGYLGLPLVPGHVWNSEHCHPELFHDPLQTLEMTFSL